MQPFGNSLVTKTMTGRADPPAPGAAVRRVRWPDDAADPADLGRLHLRPQCQRAGVRRQGLWASRSTAQPVDAATTYRVTMNNFLASGGDGFTVFNQGTNALGGAQDIDALVAYFDSFLPGAVPNPPVNRITGT